MTELVHIGTGFVRKLEMQGAREGNDGPDSSAKRSLDFNLTKLHG
jgi:hypothetical protein